MKKPEENVGFIATTLISNLISHPALNQRPHGDESNLFNKALPNMGSILKYSEAIAV